MSRVFQAFAIADLLVLAGSAGLGLLVDDRRWYLEHFAAALFAVLLTILVHVLVFTFFIGTSRMISQAVMIGHLDRTPLDRVRDSKKRVMRCVAVSVLTCVAVIALGALTDSDHAWHFWHLAAAATTIVVNACAFRMEHACIVAHTALMTEVFDAYNATRPSPDP